MNQYTNRPIYHFKLAMFIGRFQPFHNGHLFSLNKCFELAEKVIVGVGSSNESGTESNPWDYETRRNMVEAVNKRVEVVPVPDVHNDEKWGSLILNIICQYGYRPEEVIAVGNNEWTNRIMKQIGVEVYESGLYNRDELEGVKIRAMMKKGDSGWRERVPKEVLTCIK